MEMLEKVEKLREKANVSYEDAKQALEACNYDMLDAMVYLERMGKIDQPRTASYSTTPEGETSQEFEQAQRKYEDSCKSSSVGDSLNKFFEWCGKMIRKGCETTFVVTKGDKEVMSMPVIILVVILLVSFSLAAVVLIIGLFCGYRYYFIGLESTTVDMNEFCEKASEACENIKNEFQNKQ